MSSTAWGCSPAGPSPRRSLTCQGGAALALRAIDRDQPEVRGRESGLQRLGSGIRVLASVCRVKGVAATRCGGASDAVAREVGFAARGARDTDARAGRWRGQWGGAGGGAVHRFAKAAFGAHKKT